MNNAQERIGLLATGESYNKGGMSKYEIEKELGNQINDYYILQEQLLNLNYIRPSSVREEQEINSDILEKANQLASLRR